MCLSHPKGSHGPWHYFRTSSTSLTTASPACGGGAKQHAGIPRRRPFALGLKSGFEPLDDLERPGRLPVELKLKEDGYKKTLPSYMPVTPCHSPRRSLLELELNLYRHSGKGSPWLKTGSFPPAAPFLDSLSQQKKRKARQQDRWRPQDARRGALQADGALSCAGGGVVGRMPTRAGGHFSTRKCK